MVDQELIEAARVGEAEAVRSLLDRGASVTTRDPSGATALIAAAYGNHIEVARLLVAADADIDVKDSTEQSAYLIATSEVGDDTALLVILGGGDARHTEVVRVLVEGGVDVSLADGDGITPLAHTRGHGYEEIAAILVEAAADPERPTNAAVAAAKRTPLDLRVQGSALADPWTAQRKSQSMFPQEVYVSRSSSDMCRLIA